MTPRPFLFLKQNIKEGIVRHLLGPSLPVQLKARQPPHEVAARRYHYCCHIIQVASPTTAALSSPPRWFTHHSKPERCPLVQGRLHAPLKVSPRILQRRHWHTLSPPGMALMGLATKPTLPCTSSSAARAHVGNSVNHIYYV